MSRHFRLDNVWRIALEDLGIPSESVLRRAELPLDLLNQSDPMVDVNEYFRLVDAFEAEAGDPDLGLRLGQALTVDVFDPTLFAASCSPNLEIALDRVNTYKCLMGPFRIDATWEGDELRVVYRCEDRSRLPPLLGMIDVTFSLHWVRHATRERVVPLRVGIPHIPTDVEPYEAYFGLAPVYDKDYTLVFSKVDTRRPFLTVNSGMWSAFEPELRRRLAEVGADASFEERVKAALLELLPSGRSQKVDVARALGVGARTLQRRLEGEGTSFQAILAKTREGLARHYLSRTDLTLAEIAYLLGFDDPNSLYRSFKRWTGTTPEALRRTRAPRDVAVG